MIQTTPEQLERLLNRLEDCNLEFKKASNSFESRELRDYCAALANERGGKLLLGVQQKQDKTGVVTGTTLFEGTYNTISHELLRELHIRIDVEEVFYSGHRILIFHVPARSIGSFIRSSGKYKNPMRAGESLCEMDDQTIRAIMNEREPDLSAETVSGLTIQDLDATAIDRFKSLWSKNANRPDYLQYSDDKLLDSAELITEKGITLAAVLLFGKPNKITEYLPGAEIIFEWRTAGKQTRYDDRRTWREPFFLVYDQIWNAINNRNVKYPFQQGFIQRDIWAFNEKTIREAVFNAVAHRDYSISSRSIFITASPAMFTIESPGGFLPGITPDNIMFKKQWRNRRMAEAFEKADFVERSGQGVDDIFENNIREGKGLPDYHRSDSGTVILDIPASVKDSNFVAYIEKIINERQVSLSFEDIYLLEKIREHRTDLDKTSITRLKSFDLIELHGRGRGVKYLLSHKYYASTGTTGVHTRLKGIPREAQKQLITEHLTRNKIATAKDFSDIFPHLSRHSINSLLKDLKIEGKVKVEGKTRGGVWHLA